MLGDLVRGAFFGGSTPEEETLVSEVGGPPASLSFPSGAVVEHDPVEGFGRREEEYCADWAGARAGVGEDARGVITSVTAGAEGAGSRGGKGASSFRSLMVMTIRSRSIDVMCFSFPPQMPSSTMVGFASGPLDGLMRDSIPSASSFEAADSTLVDNGGTSPASARSNGRTEVSQELSGSTQNVSRVHSRHVRFSNLRPSSM